MSNKTKRKGKTLNPKREHIKAVKAQNKIKVSYVGSSPNRNKTIDFWYCNIDISLHPFERFRFIIPR